MKNEDKSNLKLAGNQIKLLTRPVSNTGSASSRCALLGRNVQRPMSAIPLLNLDYNEFEMLKNMNTRRPWSADNPIRNKSLYFDNIYTDGTTSVDSGEEIDTVLPSSNLLEELLSEPLCTWKNGKRTKQFRKNKIKRPLIKVMRRSLTQLDNDTPSAGSDTNSSIESIPTKTQILNVEPQIEQLTCKNEYDESIKAMALLPGLKTKPPIPKKPDISTPKCGKKINDPIHFEIITNNILNYSLPYTSSNKAETNLDLATNTRTLQTGETPETKVQNWFQDQKVADNIKISELNTDLSIENLKSHQTVENNAVSDSESDAHSVSSKSKNQLNDISNLEKHYISKRVNFEEFNELDVKSNYEKRKMSKNFIKENIKLTSKKFRKKLSDSESDEQLPGTTKFTPTPMKSFPDFKDSQFTDVESWMSTKIQENQNENCKTSFLDCLNKVQELQESCKQLDEISEADVTENASAEQSDNNTYDDIVSILQTLEEEDKKSHNQMKSMKKIINDELSSSESDTSKEQKPECNKNIDNKNIKDTEKYHDKINLLIADSKSNQHETIRTSLNSSSNLNDIFVFLDEVDQSCSQSLACAKDRVNSVTQVLESSLQLDTIPKLEELLEHSNFELSNYVIRLNLRLKEKSSAISVLQKELSSLREHITKMTRNTNVIIKERLKNQKEDYENAVKRHQKFIDQLITDKKTLNQQCESLVNEMKMLEDRYNSNLKAAEHKHYVELQKVKDMHIAGEKMRKERWIDTKTQKIKELTIKGIEPELEKITNRHQQELADLRSLHKREIEDLELRSARKLQQHCEALREQLTVEGEKTLAHEKDLLRHRYTRMVEAEEQNFQEQRRKLLAEHSKKVSECEERKNEALVEKDRCIKQAQMEFDDKLQVTIRKHNIELNLLKEKTELEMDTFRNNYKKQLVFQLGEKEALIREKCRQDRDKEIETVIERLEQEANETKSQMEQSFENRIRRLKEKYEKEIKDLEESERDYNKKYSENKVKLAEAEDLIVVLKTTVNQLDSQLLDTKVLADRLTSEKDNLREIIKNEMNEEILHLEAEIHVQKTEKEKELQKVYARVKVAVARKDETILELNRDLLALQEKCAYLENMMEQQRKEYLIK